MDLSGEYRIPADRETVWRALNDPEVLKQCIPGCEELEKVSDTEFTAKVTSKVGPVRAKFSGKVTLSELDPPKSYKISGEGQGGAAGFARGGATVSLEQDGDATVLRYNADAQVGGKLAQIGSRLIAGTARKLADEFFTSFAETVAPGAAVAAEEAAPAATPAPAAAPAAGGMSPMVWVGGVVVVIVVLLLVFAG
jgi:carbon monoxide dehydrogenase subunit G